MGSNLEPHGCKANVLTTQSCLHQSQLRHCNSNSETQKHFTETVRMIHKQINITLSKHSVIEQRKQTSPPQDFSQLTLDGTRKCLYMFWHIQKRKKEKLKKNVTTQITLMCQKRLQDKKDIAWGVCFHSVWNINMNLNISKINLPSLMEWQTVL